MADPLEVLLNAGIIEELVLDEAPERGFILYKNYIDLRIVASMQNLKNARSVVANHKRILILVIAVVIFFGAFLPLSFSSQPQADLNQRPENEGRSPTVSIATGWNANGTMICNAENNQYRLALVTDGTDGAILVWQDTRIGVNHIYAQHVSGDGAIQWALDTNGTLICGAAIGQWFPRVCSDGTGGAIIAWEDVRNGGYDIYAQRVDAAGSTQWTPDGILICNAIGDQSDIQIINDGAGGAVLCWQDERAGTSDVYAQRVNSQGLLQWGDNGTVICNETGPQLRTQLVNDAAGGVILAWLDLRSGNYEIYTQRVNGAGISQWGNNGTAITNVTGDKFYLDLAGDGTGGAVLVWSDRRAGNYDIYTQRVTAQGVPQWDANGTVICNVIGDQIFAQLITTGTDGSIIAWQDERTGYDIYAQRVTTLGISQWDTNGSIICNSIGAQTIPQLVRDGASGAIIVWEDTRHGNMNIYAQHVRGNGTTRWGTEGIVICNASNGQNTPQLCSNGAGGAIIAWEDSRGPFVHDIFAQSFLNSPPTANAPADFHTWNGGSDPLQWILQDDEGPGVYRVIADSPGGWYVCVDWTSWEDGVLLNIPLNRTAFGSYNYTIQYTDSCNVFGVSDTVVVTMQCLAICGPGLTVLMTTGLETSILRWLIVDTFSDTPSYQLLRNGSVLRQGTWRSDRELTYSVSDLPLGTYNITLVASEGTWVIMQDTSIVTIAQPTTDPTDFLITLLGVVIISIVGVALALIIFSQRQVTQLRADFQSLKSDVPESREKHEK